MLLKIERCRPLLNEIGSCLSENVIQKLLIVLGKKVSFWSEPCLYYVPFCEEWRTFLLLSLFACTSGLFLKYFMGKTEKKKEEKKNLYLFPTWEYDFVTLETSSKERHLRLSLQKGTTLSSIQYPGQKTWKTMSPNISLPF